MLSKTCEYALRAVIHIAREAEDAPLRASEMAWQMDVPANYLSKTLNQLARAGVLISGRGPRGGFRLARPPAEITLAEIVAPLDGGLLERSCLLGRPECTEDGACALHERWSAVREPLRCFFRDTTLTDVLRGSPVG